jgi:N-acetylglutamate synthase-like GNAT family acetyltransferase
VPLRVAKMQDADAITRVINAAFRHAESFFIERDRIAPEKVCDLLRAGFFLVAEEACVVTGCVYVEPKGERSYLGLLSVEPQLQKTGLGSKLMTPPKITAPKWVATSWTCRLSISGTNYPTFTAAADTSRLAPRRLRPV